jgi:hypothetical protein
MIRTAGIFLSLLLVIAGCSEDDSPTAPAPTQPVAFDTVADERTSGLRFVRRELIDDASQWATVWAEIMSTRSPAPPLPSVDFTRDVVILAAMGEQPDACWDTAIRNVTLTGNRFGVTIEEFRPHQSCVCPPIVAQPVHAVRVRRPERIPTASFTVERTIGTQPCN